MSVPLFSAGINYRRKINLTGMKILNVEDLYIRFERNVKSSIDSTVNIKLYDHSKTPEFSDLFFNELGIIGGAFSVLEAHSKEPLLLFRKTKNEHPDVLESDFFWFPYEGKVYDEKDAIVIETQFL